MINFKDGEALGRVREVDTAAVVVRADNADHLRRARVNRLVMLESRPGERLVGLIRRVSRNPNLSQSPENAEFVPELREDNLVYVSLVGTHFERRGEESNCFVRALEIVPEIDALCFPLEGERLGNFMRGISASHQQKLHLGAYTLDESAPAYLDGNRLFQRHVAIVGSTGAGKSYTVSRIIEQIAKLSNGNAILFDIHGEYQPLENLKPVVRYKIAGPGDNAKGMKDNILFMPYWLFDHEGITSFFVGRPPSNAANLALAVDHVIGKEKKEYLSQNKENLKDFYPTLTLDSPVPFCVKKMLEGLETLNTKNGKKDDGNDRSQDNIDFKKLEGTLGLLIQRIRAKAKDSGLTFLFGGEKETRNVEWLFHLVKTLVSGAEESENNHGVKIIDFSEVPSEILPLIVSLVARVVFMAQRWMPRDKARHPIALFCDEAHVYIPNKDEKGTDKTSVGVFETIAKEGRKYGIGLVVISQRPADVNSTVLSQCNNFIAMRLTNGNDQRVIRDLFPDDLGNFADELSVLDTGEAIVVGDASVLPARIQVQKVEYEPKSATVSFWEKWQDVNSNNESEQAVKNWLRQTLATDNKRNT